MQHRQVVFVLCISGFSTVQPEHPNLVVYLEPPSEQL